MPKPPKKSSWLDTAGWTFWFVVFLVLVGPSWYVFWLIRYTRSHWSSTVILAIVAAAVGAGLISWAVNTLIQYRQKRQRTLQRKKARKNK